MILAIRLTLVLMTLINLSDIVLVWADVRAPSGSHLIPHSRDHDEERQNARANDTNTTGPFASDESMEQEMDELVRSLKLAHESLEEIVGQQVGRLYPIVEQAVAAAYLSKQCSRDLLQTVRSARNRQRWAAQLLSSFGKFLTGFAGDRFIIGSAGSAADCVHVPHNTVIGHSRYCSMQFALLVPDYYRYNFVMGKDKRSFSRLLAGTWGNRTWSARDLSEDKTVEHNQDALGSWTAGMLARPHMFQEIFWGTCFPVSCSLFDVSKIAYYLDHQTGLSLNSVSCSRSHEKGRSSVDDQPQGSTIGAQGDLNAGAIIWKPDATRLQLVALMILSFLTGIIVFATLIDVLFVRVPEWFGWNGDAPEAGPSIWSGRISALRTLVDYCSLSKNFKRLLDFDHRFNRGQILCINGIRCIVSFMVISKHFMFSVDISQSSLSLLSQFLQDINWLNAFFIISGFVNALTTFTRRRNVDARDDFSIKAYTIGRYLRLLPQVLLITALLILLPILSDSPRWRRAVGDEFNRCSEQWWTQILFIQSFFFPRCNSPAWYLTAEMMFHLSALIVIYLAFNYNPKAPHILFSLVLLVSTIASAVNHQRHKFGIDPYEENPNIYNAYYLIDQSDFHYNPLTYVFQYYLGLYLGFIFATDHARICTWLTARRVHFTWILVISLLIVQHCVIKYSILGTKLAAPLPTALWTLKRLIWDTFFTWTIVACSLGFGGWINDFLSCKLFVILGRASYMIYLVQILVKSVVDVGLEMIHWQNHALLPFILTGAIISATLFGTALCLVFELPWLQIHRKIVQYIR